MNLRFNADVMKMFVEGKLKETRPEVIARRFRGVAIEFYKAALKETPQYSGHMASNLRITYGGQTAGPVDKFYRGYGVQFDKTFKPKSKGHPAAMSAADDANRWINGIVPDIKQTYTFGYVGEPDEAYYSGIEQGNNLRDVNAPGYALARANDIVKKKFSGPGSVVFRQLVDFEEI